IDNLYRIATNILGHTICPLGDAAALPIRSYITKFRDEFESYVKEKKRTFFDETVANVH
ncbi:MAG: NADH-quinone oxidoreductase subunit F, partial [Phototrophicales bacterium]